MKTYHWFNLIKALRAATSITKRKRILIKAGFNPNVKLSLQDLAKETVWKPTM